MHYSQIKSEVRRLIAEGTVLPAHPLALDANRKLDKIHQRALTRYYIDAGSGGLAVGVHTTQFAIREVGLYRPVLELAADTAANWTTRPLALVAGVSGPTKQALAEADTARGIGYHAGLLSLAAMRLASEDEIVTHCRSVAREIPLVGFYLQPAVGGVVLSANFWRRFAEIENVVTIKIAPFNRYRTLDVLRGVLAASALDRIAPEELTSIFTLGTAAAKVQSINIQRRTDDIRAGSTGFSAAGLAMQGTGPGYSGTFGITTGVAGPSGDDGKASKEIQTVAPEDKRWGAFVTGTGEWISVTGDYNARGYELTTGGFTVGVDYKLTPHVAVGINAGYVGTTTDLTGGGRISVNGGKLGFYGTFFENRQPAAPASTGLSQDTSKESKEVIAPAEVNPGWYADVAVDGGYSSYSISRAAFEGAARSQTDGGDLNVLAGVGYDFKKGALTFGPTATFNYTYVGIGSFTERGSLAPLHFGSQGQDSLRSAFGFKASYDCKVGGLAIKPEIRAAWQHEYGDSVYAIDSSFANGAGGTFTVNGPKLGRDSVLLGAGFAVQCNDRCSAYVYYDGELGRTNYHAAAVTGGVRFAF